MQATARQLAVLSATILGLASGSRAAVPGVCRMELLWPPDRNQIPFQFRDCTGRAVTGEGELHVKLKLKGDKVHEESFAVRRKDFQDFKGDGPAFVASCRAASCGDGSYFPKLLAASFRNEGRTINLERIPISLQVQGNGTPTEEQTNNDVSISGLYLTLSPVEKAVKAGEPVKVKLGIKTARHEGRALAVAPDSGETREFFAFAIVDSDGNQIPAIYPEGIFEAPKYNPRRFYDEKGFSNKAAIQLKPSEDATWEFDLVNGGVRGWSGKFPRLAKKGIYKIQAVYGSCLFCRAGDGINGRAFSNTVMVTVR